MYRKCATELSARHQRQVTDSLLELMKRMPYEEITVTQLSREAKVTRRVFYHLFSNKLGALHALVEQKLLDIESYCLEEPDELLRFFRYWREQKDFLDALVENGMSGLLLEQMINRVLTEDYDVRHWLRSNGWSQNSKEVIIFGLSGLVGLIFSWYFSHFQQSPEELAGVVAQLVQNGMK